MRVNIPSYRGSRSLVGVTFPTGRAPESASNLLATDATGVGAFQLTGGIAVEQSFGHFLLNLTGLVGWRAPRSVLGVDETLGVQFQGLFGVGYAFDNDASLAVSFGYIAELDAVINGAKVPDSGRALPTIGLSGSLPLGESWRLQGGMNTTPPFQDSAGTKPLGLDSLCVFLDLDMKNLGSPLVCAMLLIAPISASGSEPTLPNLALEATNGRTLGAPPHGKRSAVYRLHFLLGTLSMHGGARRPREPARKCLPSQGRSAFSGRLGGRRRSGARPDGGPTTPVPLSDSGGPQRKARASV